MTSERQEGKMARRFGAYELVRKLGRGGMAETYEAVRRHGGVVQRVCVKCILPDFESDAEFVELFLREARISSTLRHANVVQVLDFGEQAGRHYLVLELVDGVDLRNLLRQLMSAGDRLPAGVLAHLAIELAQALDYAHAARPDGSVQGVVHRDISPSNVLLSPTGDVKLTDFGVAKVMDFTSCTRTGAVKGKIPYMAPEYARGGEYDARSDLFSLGVLLYECAAGRRPFDGASEVETLERVHSGRHVPLQDLASKDLSPALVQAIEALIARDPDDRPTTAGDLLQRLGDATPPPSARLRLGKTVAELERRAEGERERLGLDATMRATPEGTAVVASERPKAWIVDTAPPDAETRTRLPEPERPVPSVTDTPTRRHSLGASRGTSHATQGTRADPPQETPTPEPDPVVTPEPDPVVTPEPDPVVTPDPSAPLPWRSSSLALLALLLFIALGIGAGIWLLSAGAG